MKDSFKALFKLFSTCGGKEFMMARCRVQSSMVKEGVMKMFDAIFDCHILGAVASGK